MPPRNETKKGKDASAAHTHDERPDEEPLVAVILADSFNDKYTPLSVSVPRCLLPLANVPLLHYALESAAQARVAHVYVLARSHAAQIRQHVAHVVVPTMLGPQGIGITVITTPEARSEGDALRELDAKQILRSDFLLFRGDSVCTIDLAPIVEEHRVRRKTNKDAIMTMCCVTRPLPVLPSDTRQAHNLAHTPTHTPIFYTDPATSEVVHYDVLRPDDAPRPSMLPFDLLRLDDKSGYADIDVRADLVEAGVEVCSVDVPPLFSENFDYQSFSDDFVPGILTSDLLESKMYVHVARTGYASRAQDTASYHAIVRDILHRHASPLLPGSTAWLGERVVETAEGSFVALPTEVASSAALGGASLVGSRCVVGDQARIHASVLDEDVHVGQATVLDKSHVHAHARIGAHVHMTSCIVGHRAVVLDRVTLGPGCVLGADCVVGPDVRLEAGTRIGSRSKRSWDEGEEEEEHAEEERAADTDADPADHDADLDRKTRLTATGAFGRQARGYVWPNILRATRGMPRDTATAEHKGGEEEEEEEEEDEEEEEEEESIMAQRLGSIGYADALDAGMLGDGDEGHTARHDEESVSSIDQDSEWDAAEEEEEEEESDSSSLSSLVASRVTNLTLGTTGESRLEQDAESARLAEFDSEARASLARALQERYSADNALLELKTLRMASNVAPRQVQRVAVEALLHDCQPSDAKQVQTQVQRYAPLLTAIAADQPVDALVAMQTFCATHTSHTPLFVPLLKLFYNEDVVSDEAIVAWWRSKGSQSGPQAMHDLRSRAQGVVRYILESSDDDDEEEEEEDEEEEDDE